MYEVIRYFTDLQDFSHPYNVGDIFPREGFFAEEKRIRELCGSKNKQKTPLIKLFVNSNAIYLEQELQSISSKEIKRIAQENGYELPPSPPASKEEIISAFMEQQEMK